MADKSKQSGFDTDRQYLGGVYAKALLGAAGEPDQAAAILDEMDSFVDDLLDNLPQLEGALVSPRVPHEAKVQMLDKALSGKADPKLLNFLKVLSRHERMDCVRDVRRAARQMFNAAQGRVEVHLQTAQPLETGDLGSVTDRLKQALGKDVAVTTDVDPELIGGVVMRIGDTVYDGSVANQLRKIRKEAISKVMDQFRDQADRFAGA